MMSADFVIRIAEQGVYMILIVCGPLLLLSLAVGLIISIFQATTQIQEQTLTFVPKILTVLGATVLLGPWMLRIMIDFTNRLFNNMTQFIG